MARRRRIAAATAALAVAAGGCGGDDERVDRPEDGYGVGPFRKTLETAERAIERAGVDIEQTSAEAPTTQPLPIRARSYRAPDGTRFALLEFRSAASALRAQPSVARDGRLRRVIGPEDNLLLVVTRPAGPDRFAVVRAVRRHADDN